MEHEVVEKRAVLATAAQTFLKLTHNVAPGVTKRSPFQPVMRKSAEDASVCEGEDFQLASYDCGKHLCYDEHFLTNESWRGKRENAWIMKSSVHRDTSNMNHVLRHRGKSLILAYMKSKLLQFSDTCLSQFHGGFLDADIGGPPKSDFGEINKALRELDEALTVSEGFTHGECRGWTLQTQPGLIMKLRATSPGTELPTIKIAVSRSQTGGGSSHAKRSASPQIFIAH